MENNMIQINPVAFHLLGLPVRWYAIIIACAMLLSVELALREVERKGFDSDRVMDLLMWAIPLGFVGARIYYVLFEWEYYSQHLGQIIAIWNGGIAIYGGIIAAVITAYVYARRWGFSVRFLADVAAPYLLLAQAIGRWGNFVNREAHGGLASESFLREVLHLPSFIVDRMLINGSYYHPTFLYESVWNLLGVGLLLFLRRKKNFLRLGDTALLYVIWYAFGRFFIEGVRTDSLYLGPFRVSQMLSLILFIVGGSLFLYRRYYQEKAPYYSQFHGPFKKVRKS